MILLRLETCGEASDMLSLAETMNPLHAHWGFDDGGIIPLQTDFWAQSL